MALRLYNTLSRALETFHPQDPRKVLVYGCGPTVYDFPHIGNYRSFVVYDLLHRYLEWLGYGVRFVTNLTDVDDKTIQGALGEGITVAEYTPRFAEAFLLDAQTLGIRPADAYPRATHYVAAMIEFVRRLQDKGMAYQAEDGSVYFPIGRFLGYGKLSRMDPKGVKPGARVAVDEYAKDDARDFALWKAARPEDEAAGAVWDSPWGRGRPGWHLECSVMSMAELGETLDIHLGGEDLVFPHHEDEIAQTEALTGKPFVRYWLHIKHLLLEGQKMSKSLGNTLTVRDLLDRGFEPAAIRHQLLSAQYRKELNFTMGGLEASSRAVQRLVDFEVRLREGPTDPQAPPTALASLAREALDRFREAMDDDLNSPEAMAALFVFVNEVNGELDRMRGPFPPGDRDAALSALVRMDDVLGLLELARQSRGVDPTTAGWIEEKIRERTEARRKQDFSRADAIRAELLSRGIVLEDTPSGTRWKVVR